MQDLNTAMVEFIRRDGRSLHELAKLAGVSKSILGRYMRGERGISLTTAAKLARVLGLELRRAKRR